MIHAGLGDDQGRAVPDPPVRESEGPDRPRGKQGLRDEQVHILVDIHAPLGRDVRAERGARNDEPPVPREGLRIHHVEGTRQDRRRIAGSDGGHGVIDAQDLVPDGRMGIGDAHDAAPGGRVESLDRGNQVRRIREWGGRLDQDQRPEARAIGLQHLQGM